MDTEKCFICGKGKNDWEGEGISAGSLNFCGEQCERISKSKKFDQRAPERAITDIEKADAYDANDMQPPLDEAPVKAGGSRDR